MADMKIDYSALWDLGNDARQSQMSQRKDHQTQAENQRLKIPYFQALSDKNRAKLEEAARIRAEYQRDILLSDSLRCEINIGLKAGEDIYTLFLKAAKAISLITSDMAFYEVARKDLLSIYGKGLNNPSVLQIELDEIHNRLDKLKQAVERESEPDTVERLKTAIQFHARAAAQIKNRIERSNQGG
ncbi:MAG: hypothetical protein HDT43_01845 [Ruminococcaceae bacterium]|nr:hypothetical protein [Oscillospiraceae bacterium]